MLYIGLGFGAMEWSETGVGWGWGWGGWGGVGVIIYYSLSSPGFRLSRYKARLARLRCNSVKCSLQS